MKTIIPLILIVLNLFLIINCKDDKLLKITKLSTSDVVEKSFTSAKVGGTFIDKSNNVGVYGHCWGTTVNPTNSGSKTSFTGITNDNFESNLTSLTANTKYYVRAYALDGASVVYGNEVNFTTNSYILPTLTTVTISNITHSSAKSGGNSIIDGGSPITIKGICWSVNHNPTTADNKTENGTGTVEFTSDLTVLQANTIYYIRSYATNIVGTGYGNEVSFKTSESPAITIASPVAAAHWMEMEQKEITWTSNIQGNVNIALFKSNVLLKSIYSATPNDGSYIWTLPQDLVYGTDYQLKITSSDNSAVFGMSEMFKISESSGSTGTLSDYQGNSYGTIKIGKQWWMKENLKTTKLQGISGDINITNVSDNAAWNSLTNSDKAYCWYNNDVANKTLNGALYTWAAASWGTNPSDLNPSGIRGICPIGWHLPSTSEWGELLNFLGSNAGGKLKESGTSHWSSPNTDATNESVFTALPGGRRYSNGDFFGLNTNGWWWTSSHGTMFSTTEVYLMYIPLSYSNGQITYPNAINLGNGFVSKCGLSVRCMRD